MPRPRLSTSAAPLPPARHDSAGQHVAAACGVPLITVFAGFGPGCTVIRAESRDPQECLARVKEALEAMPALA
jgi:hypothetical protein